MKFDFSFVCSTMAAITAPTNYPALLLLFIQNQQLLLLPEAYQRITSHAVQDSFPPDENVSFNDMDQVEVKTLLYHPNQWDSEENQDLVWLWSDYGQS